MKDVIIDGYVTKNIEVRTTRVGQNVTSFSINSPNYNRETKTSTPQFFNCEYWHNGQRDDKALNIVEGALLILWGQLAYDSWQDNQGNNRSSVKIKVREIGLIRGPQQRQPKTVPQAPVQQVPIQQQVPSQQQYIQQQQYQQQAVPMPPVSRPAAAPVVDASIYDTDIPF